MNKKIPVSLYAEMTPNPAAMKFVSNYPLVDGTKHEYNHADETTDSPLAKALFTFPFVKGVFIAENFVSVSIIDDISWDDIVLEVRDYLTNYLQAGQPVVIAGVEKEFKEPLQVSSDELPIPNKNLSGIDKKIAYILEEYVKPAVESDGGAVDFVSFNKGVLKVKLSGACNGCPSSTQTLQQGIKGIFHKLLPEVEEVVSA